MTRQIRRLEASDDRSNFDCGVGLLNDWFLQTANQHQRKNLSRTYVAILPDDPQCVVGHYALAATSIETDGMPGRQRLPRNVSAVLLARLAVDRNHKGRGVGEYLLAHALDTVLTTAAAVGVQYVVVDALDDNAAGFYRKYGFQPFTSAPRRLVLPIATIMQA